MARQQALGFARPRKKVWKRLRKDLHLSETQAAALKAVLKEAERGCIQLAADLDLAKSELKRSLKTINRLLSNAHRGLERADIRRALASIEMNGAISYLMSREAGAEIHGSTALDAHDHDRILNERTPEVMSFLIERMRRPIAEWLAIAATDIGGNRSKSDRQLLLLLLARDSRQIIGVAPSATADGPFHNLCSWVLPACGIETKGLEDAIARCLKKYRDWLCWAQLPSADHIVGSLAPSDIAAIPDDPEADLTC